MKKESIILGIVIIFLAAFLVFQNTRHSGNPLPHLKPVVEKDLTKIAVTHDGKTLTLKRKGGKWFIGDAAWPADSMAVQEWVATLSHLRLTALVSEAKAYGRYDLTKAKKTTVSAWAGKKMVRQFDIGKVAQTYQQTFVMVPGNPNVYQAMENIKRIFDRSAEDLRDKQVMTVNADAISQIDIGGEGPAITLQREDVPVKATASAKHAKAAAGEKAAAAITVTPETHIRWKNRAGQTVDRDTVERLLSQFSQMRCAAYIEGKTKKDFTDPIRTITLKGKKSYTLSLFKKTEEGYPAISSENAYPFLLRDYFVHGMQQKIDDLSHESAKPNGKEISPSSH